jgi:hypothetical protein
MKWCWILSKAFSASIGMIKCFLSLLLLMHCIALIDLHMLNLCIPGLRLTYLVMVNDHFDVLLDLVCHYFIEDFCINVY